MIDLMTYLDHHHFLNNDEFSYTQPNIKDIDDLNQVIEFIENKTVLPIIYLNTSLKVKKCILPEFNHCLYLTSEKEISQASRIFI